MKKLNLFSRILCVFFAAYFAIPISIFANLTIEPPTFPSANTLRLTLGGTDTNGNVYSILYAPELLETNTPWFIGATGAVGQTVFDFAFPTNQQLFFRAVGLTNAATETVATPAFSPGGGAYSSSQNVAITCGTLGALIYFTTNDSTPTASDNFISSGGTVFLNRITTLKAKAFKTGATDSAVASATYNINGAPIVSAGAQQIISSSSTTLEGFGADDGLPAGSTLSNRWSKVSGPGTVTFGNLNQTNSSASFGANGIYVLQLVADDSQYKTTNRVTIAVNTTLSVSLVAPSEGSTYTVPTNFILQATASISSGSVTQISFYAGSTLIGTAASAPFNLEWKTVTVGDYALTAVASTTDSNNTGLASSPVNISVSWPTNVGQFTTSFQDLEIPVAGFPISINRIYDTRFGVEGGFGFNWKLDYEQIRIEKSASLGDGYNAVNSGATDCIVPDHQTLVTVSLSETEKYYFRPTILFRASGGVSCVGHSSVTYLTEIRYRFDSVNGLGSLADIDPPNDVGMMNDNALFGSWTGVIRPGTEDSFDIENYEPDLTAFVFTAPDGTIYNFNSSGNLSRKTDRNGNFLDYAFSGITHSSGKSVSFTRDGNDRITEIFDPIAIETTGSPALAYSYDGIGNLTNVNRLIVRAVPTYENTAFSYTNATYPNHITQITDARGVAVIRNIFDASGRLAQQLDALNHATTFSFDLVAHRQTVTDRLANSVTQNFTEFGQLDSTIDAEGNVTSFAYDERGRKIAETNGVGQSTSYAYDSRDQLTAVTNEIGAATTATYNSFGQVLTSLNALGNGTTNTYDANGNLIALTNALSVVSRYGYDAQGNRVAETNAFGAGVQSVSLSKYNEFGYLTNFTDALGNSTAYTYDANGNRLTETRTRTTPGGTQTLLTTSTFDAANRVVQTIEPDGFTNKIVFNSIGKQSQTIDKLSRTNFFFHDARGLLTNTTHADGLFETTQYDAEGRKINSTDRAGNSTAFRYDKAGRLTRTTFPDTSYTENIYDAAGQLRRVINGPVAGGGMTPPSISPIATSYATDAAGRRVAVTNAAGTSAQTITRYAYDANGNQTNVIDALGRTNKFVYDKLNRQTQIIYPDASTESTGYDVLDRRVAVTNQAGVVTRFGYDLAGRLVAVTNGFGATPSQITQYRYDQIGNLTNVIDALNRTNKFECDALGRRTKETLPGAQAQTFGYDATGNLIRHTNFNGVVLTNQFDALNRLTNKSSAGNYQIAFKYSATGQRTNMTDLSGTNSYTHDSRNRLLTKNTPQGKLTYTYDGFGNLATIVSTNANGTSVSYSYDPLNRLTNVVDRFTNNTAYAFDGVGNLQTVRYANAVTNTYNYNSLNRLTNLTTKTSVGTIASFTYTLESAGNRTNLIESFNSVNRTNVWKYDSLYRLTNETITASSGPTGSITNRYDAVGNRTNRLSSVSGITNQTFTFGTNDWLTSDVYDNNGNTRTNGANVYLYDAENRLTNFNSGTAVFVYDGDGNRVRKTVGGVTTYYLVDDRNPSGYAQVLEEFTSFGSAPTLFTYGLDLISQRQTNGTTSFYGYDGNENTRFLTATNATISDTYVYDAFGIQLASTGSTPNNYKYTGEQHDPNLGFVYLRARYLNPNTGRFWNRDTFQGRIEDPASLHKYLYCKGNPVNLTDPSGLDGTLTSTISVTGIQGILAGIQLPALNIAYVKVAATVGVIALTLKGDKSDEANGNYVYRRLSDVQAASQFVKLGIWASAPTAIVSPSEHIRGTDLSPWISSSRRFDVPLKLYRDNPKNPVVKINLRRVPSLHLDFTNPALLATLEDDYVRGLATLASEVLIFEYVPPIAIIAVTPGQ